MTLKIDIEEGKQFHVDRGSGYIGIGGGLVISFTVSIAGLQIEFEDEWDAVALAKAILVRMGVKR